MNLVHLVKKLDEMYCDDEYPYVGHCTFCPLQILKWQRKYNVIVNVLKDLDGLMNKNILYNIYYFVAKNS